MKVDYFEDRTVFVNGKATAEIRFDDKDGEIVGISVDGAGARQLLEELHLPTEVKRHRMRMFGLEPTKKGLKVKPAVGAKSPEWLADLAQKYADAQYRSRTPARLLAEANGVDVSVVYNWVVQARGAGYLPMGRGD